MKRSQDPVRADLAYLGPTLFAQEYRRRGGPSGKRPGKAAAIAAAKR